MRLALSLGCWMVCHCAASALAGHGGEEMAFVLLREDTASSKAFKSQSFVLDETRIVTGGPDTRYRTRLKRARGWALQDEVFECNVPALQVLGSFALPPLVLATDEEYRFTVYAPGYVAVTVYPEGIHNEKEPSGPQPAIFKSHGESPGTHRNVRGDELPLNKGPTGRRFELRLERLPVQSFWEVDSNTFYAQLCSLEEAIKAGHLEKVAAEDRRLVREAIRVQFESSVATLEKARDVQAQSAAGFIAQVKPVYDRLKPWLEGRDDGPTRQRPASRPGDGVPSSRPGT